MLLPKSTFVFIVCLDFLFFREEAVTEVWTTGTYQVINQLKAL